MADLEHLVLSGALFNPESRSSSPARSNSSAEWPTEPYSEDEDNNKNSDDESHPNPNIPTEPPRESVGMGPGRTGVKGVIRDRDEVLASEKAKKADGVKELNKRMAKLGEFAGKSTAEEEWEKKRAADVEAKGVTGAGASALRSGTGGGGRFGHLREVGEGGFVDAVEERDVFVVVHLYDSSLDRCADLDDTLARLARSNPNTKFIRTRASAIGFASTNSSRPKTGAGSHKPGKTYIISENMTFDNEDDEEEEEEEEDDVDLDMLPTMLVYRGGEVVHTWVRVDWEAGKEGVESLLLKHNILGGKRTRVDLDDYPDENLSD